MWSFYDGNGFMDESPEIITGMSSITVINVFDIIAKSEVISS